MPGHKQGKGIPKRFLGRLEAFDLTEIPGLDNLHSPHGVIKTAQELAAKAFHADQTYFLVNGSTCGMHAMIMTICNPGDKLIVARDCHKSVIGGMMLARARPVYVKPEFDSEFGISTMLKPVEIKKALEQNPDAKAVIITRPGYYGICSDIEAIADIVHSYGRTLAVDEAHGAHLCFSDRLPASAMQAGADICVQSAHKTLPAFTQGAYLHVRRGRVDLEKLGFCLKLLQTSSPSYMIMASLDIARAVMEYDGGKLLGRLLENIAWFRESVLKEGIWQVLDENRLRGAELDSTRIVLNARKLGITGYELERSLRENYSIQVEMSDFYNIICIGTVADSQEDYEKLLFALRDLGERPVNALPLRAAPPFDLPIPRQKIELGDITGCKSAYVDFDKALGKTSLDIVTPYPPGIPVICPGEEITEQALVLLDCIVKSGGYVQGLGVGRRIRVAV